MMSKPKTSKSKIPPALREKVWRIFFDSNIDGRCQCCGGVITISNWHAGHKIPESKKGPTSADNLVPLCMSCNTSMGDVDFYTYKNKYYPFSDEPGDLSNDFLLKLSSLVFDIGGASLDSKTRLIKIRDRLNKMIDDKIADL